MAVLQEEEQLMPPLEATELEQLSTSQEEIADQLYHATTQVPVPSEQDLSHLGDRYTPYLPLYA